MKIQPVEYAILCDHASLSVDGKLNMNGVFEHFMAQDVPVHHPQLFVVSKMILPRGDHNITLSLMQEDKVMAKAKLEKKVEQELAPHTHFWGIRNLKIEEFKPLELQILLEGQQVYVKRIPVIQSKKREADAK